MCSASKIKCNKAKPVCSRCDKLGCHCSYSPTRRMGRPHPPRHTQSQIMPKVTREPAKRLASVQTRHESFEPESDASVNEFRGLQIRGKRPKEFRGPGAEFSDHYISDGQAFATLPSQPAKAYNFKRPSMAMQKESMENMRMFSFNGQVSISDSEGFFHHGLPSDNVGTLLSSVSQSRRTSSTVDKMSGMSSYGEGSASSNASEEDCAILAMYTLEELNQTSLKRATSGASLDEMETESVDGPIKSVSMAVQSISTILVCPCSQKTDVRILAATVCTAILDTYGAIIRNCTHRQSVRVLDELPRVASLVLQFNKRCTQNSKECSGNLLPALGASLKTRLQSLTNDCIAQD